MALLGKQTCAQCGKEFSRSANFCPYCGAPASKGRAVCGHCGASISAAATYCPHCGRPVEETAVPTLISNRWARGPEDFATRVEVEDVRGFFRKGLIIEAGTKAIFLHDGRNVGVLGPDRYTMDSLFKRIVTLGTAERITAILVDSGEVDLEFTVPDLYTTDPLKIELRCHVAVQVVNPVLFFTNLMKGRRNFTLRQLRSYLFDEIQNAAAEAVGRHSVAELSSNLALKQEFATDIEAHLNRTFERVGLGFDRVRTLDYRHERFDAITGIREETFLQLSEEEAKLQRRKRLFDVYDAAEVQAIAEETAKVRHFEERAQVWERLRRAVLSDRIAEVRSEEEWAEFIAEVDRRRLLRQDELETLKRELRERQEDHERQRAYLMAKADLERDYELKMLELARRRDLSLEELELEQQLARRRVEGELAIQEKRLAFELERRRQEALTRAEIEDLERDQDLKDLELARKGFQIILEKRRAEMEAELAAEERRLEMELRRFREEREAELARIQALSQLSTEALIAVSGPEQARLLAELRRTEALKGMTEEQILALAAERSPEVARAFQEKFRALSTEQQAQMYERLLKDREAATAQLVQALQEAARMQQETAFKALETQRDVSVAYAGQAGPGQPSIVVTPGGTVPPTVVSPGTVTPGEWVICKRCHSKSPAGTKYCQNCGEPFFE